MVTRTLITFIALTAILFSGVIQAQEEKSPIVMKVGIKLAPAFVVDEGYLANGIQSRFKQYSGDAIDKWEAIYDGTTAYTVYPTVDAMLSGVASGEVDVAVGAISVTASREGLVDFLIPYTQTGLSFASVAQDNVLDIFKAVIPTLLWGLGIIFLVNLLAGALFALVEHRNNDDVKSTWTSMFIGFYWSSATLTTVGYGDVAAKTPLGKILSTVWMWSGLIITGLMMSLVVSAVSVETNDTVTFNILDSKIAAVEGSAGLHYAQKLAQKKNIHTYDTLEEAIASVASGKTDGVIGDKVLLDSVAIDYPDVVVSPTLLTKDYYAFAVADGSELTESLNRRLLVNSEK